MKSVENIQALGMKSGAIADSQLSVSSEFNAYHGKQRSRLHTKETSSAARGAWASLRNDVNQWIQIDLGYISNVTHVATQGRNGYEYLQCVAKYKMQYSDNGATFLFYKREGQSIDAVSHCSFQCLRVLTGQCPVEITKFRSSYFRTLSLNDTIQLNLINWIL